jgi:hypothetical protein
MPARATPGLRFTGHAPKVIVPSVLESEFTKA